MRTDIGQAIEGNCFVFGEQCAELVDAFVFGAETRGLPAQCLSAFPEDRRLRIPMRPDNRSLNLSNAVAVVVYEGWRQHDFAGAVAQGD